MKTLTIKNNSLLLYWLRKVGGVYIPKNESFYTTYTYDFFEKKTYITVNGFPIKVLEKQNNNTIGRYVTFKRTPDKRFDSIEEEFFEKYCGKIIKVHDFYSNGYYLTVPDYIELTILNLSREGQ